MPAATTQEILDLLEEATQCPEGTLTEDQVMAEFEGWDSMGMVLFIGLVRDELGVELNVHDLRESRTAADLARRIQEKGAA